MKTTTRNFSTNKLFEKNRFWMIFYSTIERPRSVKEINKMWGLKESNTLYHATSTLKKSQEFDFLEEINFDEVYKVIKRRFKVSNGEMDKDASIRRRQAFKEDHLNKHLKTFSKKEKYLKFNYDKVLESFFGIKNLQFGYIFEIEEIQKFFNEKNLKLIFGKNEDFKYGSIFLDAILDLVESIGSYYPWLIDIYEHNKMGKKIYQTPPKLGNYESRDVRENLHQFVHMPMSTPIKDKWDFVNRFSIIIARNLKELKIFLAEYNQLKTKLFHWLDHITTILPNVILQNEELTKREYKKLKRWHDSLIDQIGEFILKDGEDMDDWEDAEDEYYENLTKKFGIKMRRSKEIWNVSS